MPSAYASAGLTGLAEYSPGIRDVDGVCCFEVLYFDVFASALDFLKSPTLWEFACDWTKPASPARLVGTAT